MLSTQANKKFKPRLQVVATKCSQSTPTNHLYSPSSVLADDSPYSPAASSTSFISSVSWVAEKSASELGSLLKNAYKSLREKEKNLFLAAEIGKSLLEHNQSLKQDYEKLLQSVKQCESVSSKEEQDHTMRLISNKKAYDTIIESLERKNAEIQLLLNQSNQNSLLTQQQYEKKQRKLESEIEILQQSLESAANKIQELEEVNLEKQARWRRINQKRDFEQQQQEEDFELLQELTTKMQELFMENKQLQCSKKQVEEKLIVSLHDLEKLQNQFENFELTHQGYANLQEAFERQTIHIKELNDTLEDHRQILSRLREKGYLNHIDNDEHHLDDGSTTTATRQSLMGELEHAFGFSPMTRKRSLSDSHLSTHSSFSSKIFDLASMTERNLTSFYNAPGNYALDTLLSSVVGMEDHRAIMNEAELLLSSKYDYATTDLFEPEGNGSLYAELDLYPTTLPTISHHLLKEDEQQVIAPKGLSNRILFHIRYLFRSIFRWCRFAIILVTAVLINLWKGPDLLLK